MPIKFGEGILENDDFTLETDGNGDLVQTHKQTGAQFKFDSTKMRWIPVEGLDLEGADVSNVGKFDSTSVNTDELQRVYDHIVEDAADLADALDDAEANTNVRIHLPDVDGSPLKPFDHKSDSNPWDIKGGTVIHGYHVGRDSPVRDSLEADQGSVIDCQGNTLFSATGQTGIELKSLGVKNFEHVISAGEALSGGTGDEYGLTQSKLYDISCWNGTDYAFEWINSQRINYQSVIVSDAYHTHVIGAHDNFQPQNSVWTDAHCTPPDNAKPAFYFEARDTSVNYITLVRPQVIIGGGDGTNAALKLEGQSGARPNSIRVVAGDFEGAYNRYVDATYLSNSHIEVDHNKLADSEEVYLDANSQVNTIHAHSDAVCHSDNASNTLLGSFEASGKWIGLGQDANKGAVLYPGGDTSTYYVELGTTTNWNNINIEGPPRMGMTSRDLSGISGTEIGEMMLHNGSDSKPQGRYEWDGSAWQGIGAASGTTITPS